MKKTISKGEDLTKYTQVVYSRVASFSLFTCFYSHAITKVWFGRPSYPGVGLLIKDQFEGICLRMTGAIQAHVATQAMDRVSIASIWRRQDRRGGQGDEGGGA